MFETCQRYPSGSSAVPGAGVRIRLAGVEHRSSRPLGLTDAVDVWVLLAAADTAVGNVADRGVSEIAGMLRDLGPEVAEATCAEYVDDKLAAFAIVAGEEVLARVAPAWQGRGLGGKILDFAEQRLRETGVGGGVQWVPSADAAAVALLRKHRWQRAYVDVQVTCDLPPREPPPAVPQGFSLHRSRGEPDLRAVHDLICAAWAIEPHWEEFLERLVMRRSYDPSLWCLAAAGKRLVGVVIGEVEAEVGWIRQLAVSPSYRGRGIAGAMLPRVLSALASRGITTAKAAVHETNPAYDLYLRHGWREASRLDCWIRELPRAQSNVIEGEAITRMRELPPA
jgi:mycothiol synthase